MHTEKDDRAVGWAWMTMLLLAGVGARWLVSADHNIAEDPFIIIESAKHLLQTGDYRIPAIGASDAVLRWSMPSWPVGFPLLLTGFFSLFGATEGVARLVTIVASSLLAPLTACLAYQFFGRRWMAIAAGMLAAAHPLAMAFGGQIFTNNLSVTLFAGSLCAMAAATLRCDHTEFVAFHDVIASAGRLSYLGLAALLSGLMLAVRDTDVVLVAPLLYMVHRCGAFAPRLLMRDWRTSARALAVVIPALLLGWSPSLYFNFVNFGSPLVSTHYQTGIRLSGSYLLGGSEALFGLPGIAVMALAIGVYQFPALLAIPAFASPRPLTRAMAAITGLIALPLLLVNGAFPVASTGAAPRYVLPLVPVACLFGAYTLDRARQSSWRAGRVAVAAIIVWQALLSYPPSRLFRVWPRLAYLAYYSPAYIARPYHNYPDHTNAMVQWVAAHTPHNALIVTPSRAQHFFYYAKRDVVVFDPPRLGEWTRFVRQRPVYLVEDRALALRPDVLAELREQLTDAGFRLMPAGSVVVFTPEAGDTTVHLFRIRSSANVGNFRGINGTSLKAFGSDHGPEASF